MKPKKCQFFDTSVLFLGHLLSAKGILANPEKVEKVKTWPVPKISKRFNHFWDYPHITGDSSVNLPKRHNAFTSLWVQPLMSTGKPGLKRTGMTLLLLLRVNQEFLNG